MKKIEYRDIGNLKNQYIAVFQNWFTKYQPKWTELRNEAPCLQIFPNKLEDILTARIEEMADWYNNYIHITIDENHIGKIKTIFKYKGYCQSLISGFFTEHSEELNLGICHYCESAYVNSYQSGKLKRNHFDLDHFLPMCYSPITSLSLFNLVPSCPICNERLKRNKIMGNNICETIRLCPTSDKYDFDKQVRISVIPTEAYCSIHYMDNPDKFKIEFVTRSEEYKNEIDVFKLNDRYDFHKCEALRLLDLKQNYPESHIQMIAELLGRDKGSIKESIFAEHFTNDNRRVFAKLHRDILCTQSLTRCVHKS